MTKTNQPNKASMKIIHSFWPLPLIGQRWGINKQFEMSFNLFKLSFMYAKKLGYEVVLHTDDTGYEMLKDIGYDRIELSLNGLKEEDISFWSVGKIKALEIEGINSLHIDGDVFLKSNIIKELIESDYDVLTQMIEDEYSFNKDYRRQVELVNSVSDLVQSPVDYPLNCGIIGFKDQEFLDMYIKFFYELMALYKENETIKAAYLTEEFREMQKILIVEQYSLPVLAHKMNKNMKFVINLGDDIQSTCAHYGFVHALGWYKYSDEFQDTVKLRIKQLEEAL